MNGNNFLLTIFFLNISFLITACGRGEVQASGSNSLHTKPGARGGDEPRKLQDGGEQSYGDSAPAQHSKPHALNDSSSHADSSFLDTQTENPLPTPDNEARSTAEADSSGDDVDDLFVSEEEFKDVLNPSPKKYPEEQPGSVPCQGPYSKSGDEITDVTLSPYPLFEANQE